MTALFCDLVDSVGLAMTLDSEKLMQVIARYHDRCDEIVTAHGGYLATFMGDGVLAYFGYPTADEDDAANAISAGLAMLDAIKALDSGHETPLQARVGIATGLVVVSERLSRANDRTAAIVGKMPNLAARLQSIATPGTVVIADSTRRVIRGTFACRDLGRVALKGFTRPVQAWEIEPSEGAESRFHARLQGEPLSFVGRGRELDSLLGHWAMARDGRGQVVQILGEAGIGKSRLIEMLEQHLAADPPLRIRWFCSPQRTDTALHPLIEQLQRAAGIAREDSAADKIGKLRRLISPTDPPDSVALAALAALLSIEVEGPSPLAAMTPEKRREVTMQAIVAQFARLTESAPVLLIVEDLHWIDASSFELLQTLVAQAGERPVLMILTARPEFKPRWTELSHVHVVALARLDTGSAESLCREAGGADLPASVLRQILERSDGIPLFVEELTRSVVERLQAQGDESLEHGAEAEDLIPLSLHDSLVARLDRLGPARQIASIGAAIGRSFSHELLAEVAARPSAELGTALRQLIRSGLLGQSGTPQRRSYLFRHALIRDAAYDSLLRADRQALHTRIGTVLREKFPDVCETEPEVVAYHLARGTAEADALPFLERAGQRAALRAAHEDAVAQYRAALEIVQRGEAGSARDQRELSILVPLAMSLSSAFGYTADSVRETLTEARHICEQLGNVAALYPVLRGLCTFALVACDLDTAEELAAICREIGGSTKDPPQVIEAENATGFALAIGGRIARARPYLEDVLRMYAEVEHLGLVFPVEQDTRTSASAMLALVLQLQGETERAAQSMAQSLAWAEKLDRPFDLAFAHCYATILATFRKDFQDARRHADAAIEIARRHGFSIWMRFGELCLASALADLGEVDAAIAILEPALPPWHAAGCRIFTCQFIGQLAVCYARRGRQADARRTIDAAIAQAVSSGDRMQLSRLHRVRAEILARDSRPDRELIEGELETAIAVARAQGAIQFEEEARSAVSVLLPGREVALR